MILGNGDSTPLRDPSIAALPDGTFAITVERETGELDDVMTYTFNASGSSQGGVTIAVDATAEPNPTLIAGTGPAANIYLANTGANGNVLFDPLSAGATLPLDATTQLSERHPTGVRMFDGRIAVLWYDASLGTIAARFLTSAGSYDSVQINLDLTPYYPVSAPFAVAPSPTGGFMMAYTGALGGAGETKVLLAAVGPTGALLGSVQLVSFDQGSQHSPRITVLQDGTFAVVWTDDNLAASSTDSTIEIRLFWANGSPRSEQFTVSAPSDAILGDVTGLQDGRIVVTWTQTVNGSSEVHQQIIDPRGGVVNGSGLLYGSNAYNDTITGNSGSDTLYGLNGNDLLDGGAEKDSLDGGAGNDTLLGGIGSDVLLGGDGDDLLVGGISTDNLNGGSGNDTASYSGSSEGVHVGLDNGVVMYGDAWNDALTAIENLLGSAHGDRLRGNDGANTLNGGGGDDTLEGRAGADHLIGGEGSDTASYAGANTAVIVTLGAGIATGLSHAFGDTFASIENLEGSAFADQLIGNGGANTLTGGGGDDTLTGKEGGDHLVGGAGIDTASYAESAAVHLSLDGSLVAAGGEGAGDSFDSVENLLGSAFGDHLRSSDAVNTLTGGEGDDTLEGRGGADRLVGGNGIDTASYVASDWGVWVALDGSFDPMAPDAVGDQLEGIENLWGSLLVDRLRGDAGVNTVLGDTGDDTLDGAGGADRLDGGVGVDTASYATSTAVQVALDGAFAPSGGEAEGDLLLSIENLEGSTEGDRLRGDGGANLLAGGGGDDRLEGLDGADLLRGGEGSDTAGYAAGGAVRVALDGSLAGTGAAAGDQFEGIENLEGSGFADTLRGDGGGNVLDGGEGNDRLEGMAGADLLNGGAGRDTASYAAGGAVRVALDGSLSGLGDALGDQLLSIENLRGSGSDDRLRGDAGVNTLMGGSGHDLLEGQGGGDSLSGGGGADILRGGLGADSLTGNAGADTFQFRTLDDSPVAGRDTVTDFQRGTDRMNVSVIDANAALTGNQAFVLDAGGTFAAGEVRQTLVTGGLRLSFNADADTDAEMSILLKGVTAPLSAGDFVL